MEKQKRSFSVPVSRKQRWTLRKLSIGVCSVLLGVTLMVPSSSMVYAKETGGTTEIRTSSYHMDQESHYTATGIQESSLRYASTAYSKVNDDGSISLTMTKWADGSTGWSTNPKNEFAGKYLLSFTNDTFYEQIDRITIDDKSLEKKNDGALWAIPVTQIPKYALIGVVTNHDVKITLKNGQTLKNMGLLDTAISFSSVWMKNNGAIANESISNGYILENNTNVKNEKKTGFMAGNMSQRVLFDADNMCIKSIHTWKPNENYLESDFGWLVYVNNKFLVNF